MANIYERSSFIPGGTSVPNSHRNAFLPPAEGENVQLSKHASDPKSVRGDASTTKKSGFGSGKGKGKRSVPKRGSLKNITPKKGRGR